ncbi:uncharacterized protein LOC144124547 isoform X2 [Amblyomma americanum]
MIIDFRARSMKSEPPGSGRQPSGPFSGDMSKALTNGDRRPSEAVIRQVSLVAAFHDHISCAKSAELLDGMPCETDHLYAHCGDDAPDDSEQDRLRAIVVLHTDLIQHQQELIADRDRQIDELRAQRDELQERLRRLQEPCLVSVGCQTDEPVFEALSHSPLPLSPVQEPRVPEKADDDLRSSPLREEEHRAEPSPRVVPEVDARRDEPAVAGPELSRPAQEPVRPAQEPVRPAQEPVRPAQEPVRPAQEPVRPAQEAVRPAPEPARPAPEPARRQPPPQRPEAVRPAMPEPVRVGPPPAAEEGAERAQEAPPEPPAAPVQSSSQEAAAPPEVAPSAAAIARKTARKRPSSVLREEPDRLLWTDRPYPSWPRPPPEEALEAIEVPTWRVRTVATAYTMEGTEDLDDEVFLKRHEKPERDERRRKKWDMQRMREEQQMERLRRKQLRSQPEERPPACPRSFCGHLRNVHRIEVVEALPVVAFGQPLPDLEPDVCRLAKLAARTAA